MAHWNSKHGVHSVVNNFIPKYIAYYRGLPDSRDHFAVGSQKFQQAIFLFPPFVQDKTLVIFEFEIEPKFTKRGGFSHCAIVSYIPSVHFVMWHCIAECTVWPKEWKWALVRFFSNLCLLFKVQGNGPPKVFFYCSWKMIYVGRRRSKLNSTVHVRPIYTTIWSWH